MSVTEYYSGFKIEVTNLEVAVAGGTAEEQVKKAFYEAIDRAFEVPIAPGIAVTKYTSEVYRVVSEDPEIRALRKIEQALRPLSPAARLRVMSWMTQRYL